MKITTMKREAIAGLHDVVRQPAHVHNVSELLDELMSQFGGPRQFAAAFFQLFNAASPGGLVRARMMSDVMGLVKMQTSMLKGAATAVEGMSDAELHSVVRDFIDVRDAREAESVPTSESGGDATSGSKGGDLL